MRESGDDCDDEENDEDNVEDNGEDDDDDDDDNDDDDDKDNEDNGNDDDDEGIVENGKDEDDREDDGNMEVFSSWSNEVICSESLDDDDDIDVGCLIDEGSSGVGLVLLVFNVDDSLDIIIQI